MGSMYFGKQRKAVLLSLACACLLLIFIPYVGIRSFQARNVLRSLVLESRYSQSFHRVVGWGDTVLNLTHSLSVEETRELHRILDAAAFNRTVIVTTLNGAWTSEGTSENMLDLFLESFSIGEDTQRLLKHLVIVALDQVAFERCNMVHEHCFKLQTDGVDFSGEKFFMSADYLKMMWRRIAFLTNVLEMGYNFLFTDADIVWLRDPFRWLSSEVDFQVACDKYNGNPEDINNKPNGGFLYVPANNRTINLYRLWYESRLLYPGKHDQDVFDEIKESRQFAALGLTMRFLDTQIFSGFCRPSSDFRRVSTMHANCCKGLDKKLIDLRLVLDDWKRFKAKGTSRTLRQVKWSIKECVRKPRGLW